MRRILVRQKVQRPAIHGELLLKFSDEEDAGASSQLND
jgi:hypothetical protein